MFLNVRVCVFRVIFAAIYTRGIICQESAGRVRPGPPGTPKMPSNRISWLRTVQTDTNCNGIP